MAKVKRIGLVLLALTLVCLLAGPSWAAEKEEAGPPEGYGYGYGMMGPGWGMGPGYGMMGPGWGMGQGYGWGGTPGGRGPGPGYQGWRQMDPKQQEEYEALWKNHRRETLELRKQLLTKQLELETLWDQPKVDRAKVQTLADEAAELQAQLEKKRNEFLLQCREKFGDQGWSCPGGGRGGWR